MIAKFYDKELAENVSEIIARNIAEKHALICVEEILNLQLEFPQEYKYWENTKTEIEKIMGYAD